MSSSLLYTALTNRLAANSIGTGPQHEVSEDDQALNEWENVSHTSDDDVVDVASLPGTAPSTPRSRSRPPSPPAGGPTHTGSPSKASSRSRSAAASKSKTDPLRSLPSDISQRIFTQLSIPSLISCSAVSRRWRRSATLNYCWFRYTQVFDSFEHTETFLSIPPPPFSPSAAGSLGEASGSASAAAPPPAAGAPSPHGSGSSPSKKTSSAAATWTRREARTDWKLTFAKQVRQARRDQERSGAMGSSLSGSGYSTLSRTERLASAGIITNTERKQQQWAESESQTGYSKAQLRDHYKSQGSRGGKVKGKSGKGGVKTVEESIWD